MNPPMGPREYAEAVRAALADLPAEERDELLEDLDEHLAEVAAESEVPLTERLGSPEAYAAELRAAYEGRPAGSRRRRAAGMRDTAWSVLRRVHGWLLRIPPYRQVLAFVPELRPAWWVLRGYALALGVLAWYGERELLPADPAGWALALIAVWTSVWLGRRFAGRGPWWRRALLFGGNAAAAAAVVVVAALADSPDDAPHGGVVFHYAAPRPAMVSIQTAGSIGGGVYNIFPYAADGTPLRDVRLYDQDGNPIYTDPESYGQLVVVPCDGEPPIRNAYPLPLRPDDGIWSDERGDCVTPSPAPPSPSASTAPASAQSPTPSPSGTPDEETRKPSPTPSVTK